MKRIGGESSEEPGMLAGVAKAMKRRAPATYEFAKRVFRGSKIPALKRLNGKWTLVAPNLVVARPSEPHVLEWIEELLRPGDTFFDVGAHCGWMSLVACHRVGRSGKVVAFEPSPALVELLEYNKKANRFQQMEIVAKAVADGDGQMVPFYLMERGESVLNSLVEHRMDARAGAVEHKSMMRVETITLDEYCRVTKLCPKAVKIDVEGAELLVLQGARGLLREGRTAFIVAVHPTWLPEGQNVAELFEVFWEYGYEVAGSQVVKYEGVDFGDYLFVPGAAVSV